LAFLRLFAFASRGSPRFAGLGSDGGSFFGRHGSESALATLLAHFGKAFRADRLEGRLAAEFGLCLCCWVLKKTVKSEATLCVAFM
jgi:hypothetical protein